MLDCLFPQKSALSRQSVVDLQHKCQTVHQKLSTDLLHLHEYIAEMNTFLFVLNVALKNYSLTVLFLYST